MLVRAAIVMWWIGAAFFFVAACAGTESIPLALVFAVAWLLCWGVTYVLGGTFWRTPRLGEVSGAGDQLPEQPIIAPASTPDAIPPDQAVEEPPRRQGKRFRARTTLH